MKIRTIYFKVDNMEKAVEFWKSLLEVEPHKKFPNWHEFMISEPTPLGVNTSLRLGLLLNDFGDKFSGSNCVPVFEFSDKELPKYIEKVKKAGAKVILDGLDDDNLKSIVFEDPFGNQFELSRFHD